MHSVLETSQGFAVYLFTTNGHGDCLYLTPDKYEALAVASYLNGGECPPTWDRRTTVAGTR